MCVIEPATSEIGNGIALSIVFSNAKAADFVGIQSRQSVIYKIGVGAYHSRRCGWGLKPGTLPVEFALVIIC